MVAVGEEYGRGTSPVVYRRPAKKAAAKKKPTAKPLPPVTDPIARARELTRRGIEDIKNIPILPDNPVPGGDKGVEAILGGKKAVEDAASLLPKLNTLFSTRALWFIAGAFLILFALIRLTATSPTVQKAAGAATMVATRGLIK